MGVWPAGSWPDCDNANGIGSRWQDMDVAAGSYKWIYLILSVIITVIPVSSIAAIADWQIPGNTRQIPMSTAVQYPDKNAFNVELWNGVCAPAIVGETGMPGILNVDDSPSMCQMVSYTIESAGFRRR